MNPVLSIFDICVIFFYLISMIMTGICFYLEKNKSADKFMDGDKSFSHWVLGISIFATWISNMAIISLPALAYSSNWSYFIMFIGTPISGMFVMKFLIPIYRKESSISAYSYIERRFGRWASLYCLICYTLTNLARLGIIMYLMAFSIGYLTGYEGKWIISIVGGIVVFYTFIGGLKCVIWTDLIQAIVFIVGTLFFLVLIFLALPLGLHDTIAYANENAKFSLGSTEISFLKPTLWVFAISSLISNFQGLGTEQSFVQRYIAAKNDACAKKSVIIASSLIFLFSGILFFAGTLLFVYYDNGNASTLKDSVSKEYIILQFISEQTHVGIKGIAIVTILAAAMSSISSELNAITTLFYKHIYTKFFNTNPSYKKSLGMLYKSSIIIGAVPIMISFTIRRCTSFRSSHLPFFKSSNDRRYLRIVCPAYKSCLGFA